MKLVELYNKEGRKLLAEPQDVERFEKLGFSNGAKPDKVKKAPVRRGRKKAIEEVSDEHTE